MDTGLKALKVKPNGQGLDNGFDGENRGTLSYNGLSGEGSTRATV